MLGLNPNLDAAIMRHMMATEDAAMLAMTQPVPRLRLAPLDESHLEPVRHWRLTCPESLRTSFDLTREQQAAWFREVVCDRRSEHRFYAVLQGSCLIGQAALEHVSWENGHAEIGLLLDPAKRGQGLGREAVELVLREAFDRMRLVTVFGECYATNPATVAFWTRVTATYGGTTQMVPRRKWWGWQLWDALWFTIPVEAWRQTQGLA